MRRSSWIPFGRPLRAIARECERSSDPNFEPALLDLSDRDLDQSQTGSRTVAVYPRMLGGPASSADAARPRAGSTKC